MSNHASDKTASAVAEMSSPTIDDSSRTAQDRKDVDAHGVADVTNCLTETNPSTSTTASTAEPISKSLTTADKTKGTSDIVKVPGPASSGIQSTQPVPTVYPSRRANIFRTREKHVRFPVSGLSAVASNTQELEEADGFPTADMEEFQADVKKRMQKKTEAFMRKMSQHTWQERRVEDLGELFEIED